MWVDKTMLSLLATKIQLPPIRNGSVVRERVLSKLMRSSMTRLVLVSAPAGFGKSTALIQWAHQLREKGACIVWYALDERDNHPTRFAAYLLETFRAHHPTFSTLPQQGEQFNLQDVVDQILNAAIMTHEPVVLIVDDYHLITDPQIHDAIGRMCDQMPSNMHLAIGTRADPPLQLARLRVRGEIIEMRMGDLRFNHDEMRDWLSTSLGWQPSKSTIDKLEKTTEGWAAILALILMSQSHSDDNALTQQLAQFSQSRRHLFDYFAQEVLDRQSDPIREFLLDTCVLNRLEPDIVCAMTHQSDAPLRLNQLAAQNLFVIPLSDNQVVYRYHHLFADFLQQYLEMKDRTRYFELHRRAAKWYIAHEQAVEAVHHALAGEDYTNAAALITDHAWETLTARGEVMTIIHWWTRFPQEQIPQHPRLCLYFSRALYLIGDARQSQQLVEIAMKTLEDHPTNAPEYQTLRAITFGYQATLAAYRGDVVSGQSWISRANQLNEHVRGVDRVRIANTDAFLHYLTDDLSSAQQAYEQALALAEAIQHDFLALDAHFYLAQIDLLAGNLQAVEDRCKRLLARYPTRIAPLSAIMLPLARVHYQRNQVVEAEALLRNAIQLAHRANLPDILWFGYINLAEVLSGTRIDEAIVAITQAQSIADRFHSPIMASIIEAAEAQLMLRAGHIDEAAGWVANRSQSAHYHQQHEMTIAARILLAQGRCEAAQPLIARLIDESMQNGRTWYVIAGTVLQALAHKATRNLEKALTDIEYALILAQGHGFIRLILDEGQPVVALLREAVKHGVAADYASYLIDIATQPNTTYHPADLLTDREVEVLAYIAKGASNQDIAEALVLSLGTVKSHVHHIMNKLDAQNRTEAVNKARSLNILPH